MNKFTLEHESELDRLLVHFCKSQDTFATTTAGRSINAYECLNESTGTLIKMRHSYQKQIEANNTLDNPFDSNSKQAYQVRKNALLQKKHEFLTLCLGYATRKEERAKANAELKEAKAKLAELEEQAMTPETALALQRQKVAQLEQEAG